MKVKIVKRGAYRYNVVDLQDGTTIGVFGAYGIALDWCQIKGYVVID